MRVIERLFRPLTLRVIGALCWLACAGLGATPLPAEDVEFEFSPMERVLDTGVEMEPRRHAFTNRWLGAEQHHAHAVYVKRGTDNTLQVYYVRQTHGLTGVFAEPVSLGSAGVTVSSDPDVYVDSEGVAHVTWTGRREYDGRVVDGVYYARADDTSVTPGRLVSPDRVVSASWPRIAAVRLLGEQESRPFIAFAGNHPSQTTQETDVLLLMGPKGGGTTGQFQLTNLTNAPGQGYRHINFDLVEGLEPEDSSQRAVQGAIVYQAGNRIDAILTNGSNPTGISFRSPSTLFTGESGQEFHPAFRVQSITPDNMGYAGHMAYKEYEDGPVHYMQFSAVRGSGIDSEVFRAIFGWVGTTEYPSISVQADDVITWRSYKSVSITVYFPAERKLRVRRNTGGLSHKFELPPVPPPPGMLPIEPRRTTRFTYHAVINIPHQTFRAIGPKFTGKNAGSPQLIYRLGGELRLADSAGNLPLPPTPTPTPPPPGPGDPIVFHPNHALVQQNRRFHSNRPAVFAERSGPSAGRLHAIRPDRSQAGLIEFFYTREHSTTSSTFPTEIPVATGNEERPGTPTDLDFFVDRNGEAHLAWVGAYPAGGPGAVAVYYARLNGMQITPPRRVSPPTINTVSNPRIAAVQLPGEFAPRPHIAFVGNRPGTSYTAVSLLTGPPGGGNSGTFTLRTLTQEIGTGHRNLAFDMVEGLPPSQGAAPAVQGAIVYQLADHLYAIPSEGTDADGIILGSPAVVTTGLVDGSFRSALAIQSVSGAAKGYVAHLAYSEYGGAPLRYMQFSPLGGTSGLRTESLPAPVGPLASQAMPDIIVEPVTLIDDRFDKRVTIAFRDPDGSVLNVVRNSGGLSPRFGLAAAGTGQPRPMTPFDSTARLSFSPLSTFSANGPGLLTLAPATGGYQVRVAYTLDGRQTVSVEVGLPAPPGGTDPTPDPTPTPTPAPTLTPPPDFVSRTEIIDTLLGLRGLPLGERVHLGDRNTDEIWDAADVFLPAR